MRVVTESALQTLLAGLGGVPRVVVSGNFATPWRGSPLRFVLRSMRSQDLSGGSGQVAAELLRAGRDDVALEAIVSRVSLEPSVSSVTWSTHELAGLAAAEE